MVKHLSLHLLVISITTLSVVTSCKKSDDPVVDKTKGFIPKIQSIVPTSVVNDLRSRGMKINEGQLPPQLSGAFFVSPYKLISPYGPEDAWKVGRIIDDYRYQFHDQTDAGDIKFDYKSSADVGKGVGAFIAGNGNLFTIFAQAEGVTKTIANKQLTVITGEITAKGIKNLQYALILTEKTNDTDNELIPVGKGRIYIDGDSLSVPTSGFRLAAPVQVSSNSMLSK